MADSIDAKGTGLGEGPREVARVVEYQQGSVVSREILKGPKGAVTVFAFDEDQGLREHTAPFDALIQGIEGEAHVRVGAGDHCVKAGEILVLPASVPHAIHAPRRFKMILTMIRA